MFAPVARVRTDRTQAATHGTHAGAVEASAARSPGISEGSGRTVDEQEEQGVRASPQGRAMAASIPFWFGAGVAGGVSANIGLMQLNNMHKGCANVCTLCQFLYGVFQTLTSSSKRELLFDGSKRKISMSYHLLFAGMFFLGPYLGNTSTAVTNADFYPVFLVVRSCGTVTSMLLGWLFNGKTYNTGQVLAVAAITIGAVLTTFGCYTAGKSASGTTDDNVEVTPVPMFLLGCSLLLANLLVDSGKDVLQAHVFASFKQQEDAANAKLAADGNKKPAGPSVVDEAIVMMGVLGACMMALVAGGEVLTFFTQWVTNPTLYPPATDGVQATVGPLPLAIPVELAFLAINFYGNWNAKKICTWLNAASSAVVSSLVPMMYRL